MKRLFVLLLMKKKFRCLAEYILSIFSSAFVNSGLINIQSFSLIHFFISGESYAGIYVPTLSAQVAEGIKVGTKPIINFKGTVYLSLLALVLLSLIAFGLTKQHYFFYRGLLLPTYLGCMQMTRGIQGRARKTFSGRRSLSSISSPHSHTSHTADQLGEDDVPADQLREADVPADDIHDSDMPADQLGEDDVEDHVEEHPSDDSILLIDSEGCFTRRRGRATCETVRKLPPGTRINIEVNASVIPCNFPECTLLASYMGMIVKDPVLAPLSFDDWRRPGMKRYKTLMCEELESKFSYSQSQVRPWVLKSLGVKWRNCKASLKVRYWDGRPTDVVIAGVPEGIDALQWATLVSFWTNERNQARAVQNSQNAHMQNSPHTLGRTSLIKRQQEKSTVDCLLLFRDTRTHKDGTWTSQNAQEKWELACQILAESGLTPDSGDAEANERVFTEIMGKEHSGRVRCSGFGVTPKTYYPQASSSTGCSASGSYSRSDVRLSTVEKKCNKLE